MVSYGKSRLKVSSQRPNRRAFEPATPGFLVQCLTKFLVLYISRGGRCGCQNIVDGDFTLKSCNYNFLDYLILFLFIYLYTFLTDAARDWIEEGRGGEG